MVLLILVDGADLKPMDQDLDQELLSFTLTPLSKMEKKIRLNKPYG
jgi:hypothetical protein